MTYKCLVCHDSSAVLAQIHAPFSNTPTFFNSGHPYLSTAFGLLFFVMCWKSEKSQTALNQDDNNVKGKIKKANTTFLLLYLTYFVFTAPNAISIIVARTMATHGLTLEYHLYAFIFSHLLILIYVAERIVILCNSMVQEMMGTATHMRFQDEG